MFVGWVWVCWPLPVPVSSWRLTSIPAGRIGIPIAADVALVPFALGFGVLPVLEAGAINISEFAHLLP